MQIKISSARSIKGKHQYRNELISWEDLVERFRNPTRTYETTEEYHGKLSKQEKTVVKDKAGAFLGGWLETNEEKHNVDRNLENVVLRSILNFDFDNIDTPEQLENLTNDLRGTEKAFILYSTHSHTPNKPRVRVLMPFDREANKIEFEAVSRHIIGVKEQWAQMIDTKSFKPAQAMFYATTTQDGEYIFDYSEGEAVEVDRALNEHRRAYKEAYDGGKWWEHPKVPSERQKPLNRHISGNKSVQDPTKKPSYIGAFNRTYNVKEAIETFLADKYTEEADGKYTWNEGEGSSGAIVYHDFNEADFLYSHHETDPASDQLLNAFDLVRIHLYGDLDKQNESLPMNERESYKSMVRLLKEDTKVQKELKVLDYEINLNESSTNTAKEKSSLAENTARKAIDALDFKIDTLAKLQPQHHQFLTEDEEKQLYLNGNASTDIPNFMKELSEYKAPIETDFPVLDRVLDGGLHDGLYVIGAISSLGKTTFVLQLADQIVKNGQDVLFFSLEMSAKEIKAKSISRLTFENVLIDGKSEENAMTVRGITDLNSRQNGYTDIYGTEHPAYSSYEKSLIEKSIKQYADEAKNLYIIENTNDITVDDIRKTVEKHKKFTGNTPVVIVDYLQIITPVDDSFSEIRQSTDKAVKALKHISRDYLTPVFAISSLNRANYTSSISMTAFKESGAIEYSSDVLIGLQFSGQREIDDKNRNKKANAPTAILDHDYEKSKEPRQIELKILKNRNGVTGISIDYDYYAKYNSFHEKNLVTNKPDYKINIKQTRSIRELS